MKAKREHRIPLPRQAVELLRKQPRIVGAELVFPSSRNTPLSDMTLTAVMRRLKRTEVPHGWRSTFRDWVGDCTDYPSELAEIALAHSVGSKVGAGLPAWRHAGKAPPSDARVGRFFDANPLIVLVSHMRVRACSRVNFSAF